MNYILWVQRDSEEIEHRDEHGKVIYYDTHAAASTEAGILGTQFDYEHCTFEVREHRSLIKCKGCERYNDPITRDLYVWRSEGRVIDPTKTLVCEFCGWKVTA